MKVSDPWSAPATCTGVIRRHVAPSSLVLRRSTIQASSNAVPGSTIPNWIGEVFTRNDLRLFVDIMTENFSSRAER